LNKDINEIHQDDLKNIETIVHLAGLSNDPLGELNEELTYKINFEGTINLIRKAKIAGVKNFLYASTQSVYGISKNIENEITEDSKNIQPITAYAKSKYKAEQEMLKTKSENFRVVIFRPATVFGPSVNFRSDIVLNNLVASAYLYEKLIIQSDGKPWRPLLHVNDMCQFFIKSIDKADKLNGEIINLGYPGYNFRVIDLADKVKKIIPKAKIIIENKKIDNRTYKVCFDKAFKLFKDEINFNLNIEKSISELVNYFDKVKFNKEMFEGRKTIRIKQLKYLIENKKIFNK
jgi:nucleoside-diphosphate-sugar epimerase